MSASSESSVSHDSSAPVRAASAGPPAFDPADLVRLVRQLIRQGGGGGGAGPERPEGAEGLDRLGRFFGGEGSPRAAGHAGT